MKSIEEWKQTTQSLVDVAMGRTPAQLVIRKGTWVNVQSGEIIPGTDIAIADDRIAYIGEDASHTIGVNTKVLEAEGRYLVPGLLDGHMHIESSMLTLTEFTRTVAPLGTTGIFIDPHEIANVFGIIGVKLMADEALSQPIHVWVQIPTCVPSARGLETAGAQILPEDIEDALKWPRVIGLGEMMNFPGVFMGDDQMHAEMAVGRAHGKTVSGHYASPDLGLPFHGYVAGGAEDDHEGTRKEDAIARVRQGMKAMLRYGSGWLDVAEQVKAISEDGLDSRNFILCTDDMHAETIINEGHMDRVIRHAIEQGISPNTAIQMATINTAEHFGVSRDMGMLAPGRFADVLLVKDLHNFVAEDVVVKGIHLASHGEWLIDLPKYSYPVWVKNSVKIPKEIKREDFVVHTPSNHMVDVNVIGVIENQAPTKHLIETMTPKNEILESDIVKDIIKVAVIDRHHSTGKVQNGFVKGFGFNRKCAVATTVSHDSHNLLIVGTDDEQMAIAGNYLRTSGGGQVVVVDGEIVGSVDLPIAGLMSDKPARETAEAARTILDGFKQCGCVLNNPNMQLSLLALVVIPELRISDIGIIDVTKFEQISLIEN